MCLLVRKAKQNTDFGYAIERPSTHSLSLVNLDICSLVCVCVCVIASPTDLTYIHIHTTINADPCLTWGSSKR